MPTAVVIRVQLLYPKRELSLYSVYSAFMRIQMRIIFLSRAQKFHWIYSVLEYITTLLSQPNITPLNQTILNLK